MHIQSEGQNEGKESEADFALPQELGKTLQDTSQAKQKARQAKDKRSLS